MALESGQSFWSPYIIPKTPNVTSKGWAIASGAGDPFVLSSKSGAVNTKNPSPQIEWTPIPLNEIDRRLIELENAVEEIQNRLNNASIEASCEGGNIVVTLNI